jgi:hypothetical protein
MVIKLTTSDFENLREVDLNRKGVTAGSKGKGTKIGSICKLKRRIAGVEVVYLTYREPQHFMRKFGGFGIDEPTLDRLIEEEKYFRAISGNKKLILWVGIFYNGVNEKRFFIVDPTDFKLEGTRRAYTKDTGNAIETYGYQRFLGKDKFKILGYHPDDKIFKK